MEQREERDLVWVINTSDKRISNEMEYGRLELYRDSVACYLLYVRTTDDEELLLGIYSTPDAANSAGIKFHGILTHIFDLGIKHHKYREGTCTSL